MSIQSHTVLADFSTIINNPNTLLVCSKKHAFLLSFRKHHSSAEMDSPCLLIPEPRGRIAAAKDMLFPCRWGEQGEGQREPLEHTEAVTWAWHAPGASTGHTAEPLGQGQARWPTAQSRQAEEGLGESGRTCPRPFRLPRADPPQHPTPGIHRDANTTVIVGILCIYRLG